MWAYDFVEKRTCQGRRFRLLNVVEPSGLPDGNEFSRECLAIRVGRKLGSTEVPDARASSGTGGLTDLFISRGTPATIRSGNGPEFIATMVRRGPPGWAPRLRVVSRVPVEKRLRGSFHGRLRDELLTCEAISMLAEAKVLIEQWRKHHNTVRPHSAPSYRPPAPEVLLSRTPGPASPPSPAGSAAAIGIIIN